MRGFVCLTPYNILSPGEHTIPVKFNYSGGGVGKPADIELLVDSEKVANSRVERTIPIRLSLDETLDIGEDTGTPVMKITRCPSSSPARSKRSLLN